MSSLQIELEEDVLILHHKHGFVLEMQRVSISFINFLLVFTKSEKRIGRGLYSFLFCMVFGVIMIHSNIEYICIDFQVSEKTFDEKHFSLFDALSDEEFTDLEVIAENGKHVIILFH